MNPVKYVDLLASLAREQRKDELKRLLVARLWESGEAVEVTGHGLVKSPPLDRDEHDVNCLLYLLYSKLRKTAHDFGLDCLRHAVCELFIDELEVPTPFAGKKFDLDPVRYLGRLVGHLRVVDHPALRRKVSRTAGVYLETGLSVPFYCALLLDGDALERAIVALDVAVSVIPVNLESISPSWAKIIERVLEGSFELARPFVLSENRFLFIRLAFYGLVRMSPKKAAGRWLSELSFLAGNDSCREISHAWQAFCYHMGVVFDNDEPWREAFAAGLKSAHNLAALRSSCGEAFRQTLEHMKLEDFLVSEKGAEHQRLADAAEEAIAAAETAGYIQPYGFHDLPAILDHLASWLRGLRHYSREELPGLPSAGQDAKPARARGLGPQGVEVAQEAGQRAAECNKPQERNGKS